MVLYMLSELYAWFEDCEGKQHPINSNFHIGRSEGNDIVISDQLVSRKHALIQMQNHNEYWLVDFGSRNGTYLNKQRIVRPIRLQDGDMVRIGNCDYIFHLTNHFDTSKDVEMEISKTIYDVRTANAWLLVADIIGSTKLIATIPPDRLPLITGEWLSLCRSNIESHAGRINQFMGDGFMAYWQDLPHQELQVKKAIQALQAQQQQSTLAFRFVIHFSRVTFGGIAVGEEEHISGSGMHFVFRMEKLAGVLGLNCLLSEAAHTKLMNSIAMQDIGYYKLDGFSGEFAFYTATDPTELLVESDSVCGIDLTTLS